MKSHKKIVAILLLSFFFANPILAKTDQALSDEQRTVNAIKKVLPAVVSITVIGEKNSVRAALGSGTGFIVSPNGLIITNRHVVSIGDGLTPSFRVTMTNGKKYYAQLIGKDPLNDLAVLKIFDSRLPFVNLGDSSKLELGRTVIAIGNLYGVYHNSVTKGIVSGLNRSVVAEGQDLIENLTNVIQTDAQINLGNSGGPLIDLNGNVVGVNVAIDQTANFAIPINDVKPIVKSAITSQRVIRPRLGVQYVTLDEDMAEQLRIDDTEGAYIHGDQDSKAIVSGSPAEKAGLRVGDIILEIDGQKLNSNLTLIQKVAQYKPGQRIGLRVKREGKIFAVILVLDQFPDLQ